MLPHAPLMDPTDVPAAIFGDSTSPNRILSALPAGELARLMAEVEPLVLERGDVLHRAGTPVSDVYFPEGAIVTLGAGEEDQVEAIGRDGVVGASAARGLGSALLDATVAVPGTAIRMSADQFRDLLASSPAFGATFNRYADAQLFRIAGTVSCARQHSAIARLASVLLWLKDQAGTARLPLTHEQLAPMVGVSRRATVTEALLQLRSRGLVEMRRGGITVIDAARLQAEACPCYARSRQIFDGLFEDVGPRHRAD